MIYAVAKPKIGCIAYLYHPRALQDSDHVRREAIITKMIPEYDVFQISISIYTTIMVVKGFDFE